MAIVSAENHFKKGLEALVDENFVDAAMHFRRAIDVEHQRRVAHPDMRYLSYYGLCRAKAHGRLEEAIHSCRRAARVRSQDPEMFLNLGRVYLSARRRRNAFDSFQDGLKLDPDHAVLRRESDQLERKFPNQTGSGGSFFSKVRAVWSRPIASP